MKINLEIEVLKMKNISDLKLLLMVIFFFQGIIEKRIGFWIEMIYVNGKKCHEMIL